MIAKAKSISHTKASISYGWNNEKDAVFILKQNVVGNSPSEIALEFRFIQDQNEKCKRNTMSFVLSPTIEDGRKLTSKNLAKITNDLIKDLKLEEHQAVAFVHNDKAHKHIHLYVNRIDFRGKAYKDNFISKRAQKAAERVAILNSLTTVAQVKEQKQNLNKEIRKEIFKNHNAFINEGLVSFKDYILKMKAMGIDAEPVINKNNRLQGFRYKYNGEDLKGSEVHRSMSITKFSLALKEANRSFSFRRFRLNNNVFDLIDSAEEYVNKNLNNKIDGKNRSTNRAIGRRA